MCNKINDHAKAIDILLHNYGIAHSKYKNIKGNGSKCSLKMMRTAVLLYRSCTGNSPFSNLYTPHAVFDIPTSFMLPLRISLSDKAVDSVLLVISRVES
jgi:hypothetical protein